MGLQERKQFLLRLLTLLATQLFLTQTMYLYWRQNRRQSRKRHIDFSRRRDNRLSPNLILEEKEFMADETKQSKRVKRTWILEEEHAFIACLKQLVVDGWKGENGFRANYQMELERQMKIRLPNSGLKASPHIESKFKMWKCDYFALSDFLSRSGNSFNPITKKIDATEEHWKELLEHKREKYCKLKDKAFPYYEDWAEIFGKDRATGETAFGANEEDGSNDIAYATQYTAESGFQSQGQLPSFSSSAQDADESADSSKKTGAKLGKRKIGEDVDHILMRLDSMTENTNQTILKVAAMLGGVSDDHKQAGVIIRSMRLTPLEKMEVSSRLLNDPAKVVCFLNMSGEERSELVEQVLLRL